MNTIIDNTQLKRAWQTAFELRLCPVGDTLFAEMPDENLLRHLQICHVCREKREMPLAQRAAWQELHRRFAEAGPKPAKPLPVPSQVWSLKGSLAGWGKDGYFYKPPMVLLLEKIKGSRGFKAVQLYGDRLLMGEGDVWLENDRFGFAQGWNCYSVHEEALDGCWGAVVDKVLEQVHEVMAMKHAPVEEDSILYFFRRMEINVGGRVALPSVAVLVEEWEAVVKPVTVNGFLEQMFGSFADVFSKLHSCELPSVAESVLDLLLGAREPSATPQLSMATYLNTLPVNIVSKQPDGEIRIKTICASITDDDWQDGTYLIAGKLDDESPTGLHLLASLVYQGDTIAECINQMTAKSPYFDIVFNDVPREVSTLAHVKFLLVSP